MIIWSLGNEAGNGPNFHSTYDWIRSRAAAGLAGPSRAIQYERAIKDSNRVEFNAAYWGEIDRNTELIAPMYPYPHEIEYDPNPNPTPADVSVPARDRARP